MKDLKKVTIAGALAVAAATVVGIGAQTTSAQDRMMTEGDAPKLGTIDINALFESYPGRAEFDQQMEQLQEEFMAAQQSGDQEKMLQLQGQAQQMQQDLQANFQKDMSDAAEPVAKANNIKIVVSDVIYQAEGVEEVDLTQDLVKEME